MLHGGLCNNRSGGCWSSRLAQREEGTGILPRNRYSLNNLPVLSVTMEVQKPSVFIPTDHSFGTIARLEEVIYSQLNVVTEAQLRENPELGKGINVAFLIESGQLIMRMYNEGLLPDLKLVCNHGAGTDHLPAKFFKETGIQVTNTPGVLADALADMAMALILASGRQLLKGADIVRSADAKIFGRTDLGQDISYSTLGIIGMGNAGYKIAIRAKAFNMTIHYHNRNRRTEAEEEGVGAVYHSSLMSMLPVCDFVVICCPATPDTTGMFKMDQFRAMKKSAMIINVGRGKVIDTDSLVEALEQEEICGAGLDVTEPEPLPTGHPLLSMGDKAIIVPHWGSATVQTRAKMLQLMIDNTKAFLAGVPLLSEVKF